MMKSQTWYIAAGICLHGDYLYDGLGRRVRWLLHGVSRNANLPSIEPEINGCRPTYKKYGVQWIQQLSYLVDDLRNQDSIPGGGYRVLLLLHSNV